MPQPDYIYLPAGSYGTVAGLLIGLQLCKLPIQVVAVSVTLKPDDIAVPIKSLFDQTKDFLMQYDQSFSSLCFDEKQLSIRNTFCGEGYGRPTKGSTEAVKLFERDEGITLEDTYTAKAADALVHDVQRGLLGNKTVLFWLTFYGDTCKNICENISYKELPSEFHAYFS